MASIYEKAKSRLVDQLAKRKAENMEKPSKLVIELEKKRKENQLTYGVSELVINLERKKTLKEKIIKHWKKANTNSDEVTKEKLEALFLKEFGYPLEISQLVLDLESKARIDAATKTA